MEPHGQCNGSPHGDQRDPPDRRTPAPEGCGGGLPARPLVLVGLMGAGKTCVGRALARLVGRPFVDADDEIEAAAKMAITDIFATYGEDEFRALERRVMARLLQGPPIILATGGGAFMAPDTRDLIAAHGLSVWLKADLDLLVSRTAGRSHRPLLNQGDPREILSRLMADRDPIYALADATVEAGRDSPTATARRILAAVAALPSRPAPPPPENDESR